jgi:hypothetical protein
VFELNLARQEREFIIFHIIFSLIAALILLIPLLPIGWKLFILVIIYNVGIIFFAIQREYRLWQDIWIFTILISVFQVFPDWFLSAELNILVFPEDGLFKIGTVSGYMLGLWSIPLIIIIFTGIRINERKDLKMSYLAVSFVTLMIFTVSETTIWMIGSWYAQNVFTLFGHLALYIIFPELILGVSSYWVFLYLQKKPEIYKIPLSFLVMLLYLGSCSFFYFVIEEILML